MVVSRGGGEPGSGAGRGGRARGVVLEVRALEVRRGGRRLLGPLDWRVAGGEHWVVLGANGSGKSSLLHCLSGWMVPTGGEVSVGGDRYGASDWRAVQRHVALVAHSLSRRIEPWQVAWEVVASGVSGLVNAFEPPPPEAVRRARPVVRRLGLGTVAGDPWETLSQGERQRVLIARALASRPRLLLLDEPCAGLDPVARARFLERVEAETRSPRGPSLVLVTHHVEEITPGFTHALVLGRGRVVAAGPVGEAVTGAVMSEAFGVKVAVVRRGGGMALEV